jgi:hypothetical protein
MNSGEPPESPGAFVPELKVLSEILLLTGSSSMQLLLPCTARNSEAGLVDIEGLPNKFIDRMSPGLIV